MTFRSTTAPMLRRTSSILTLALAATVSLAQDGTPGVPPGNGLPPQAHGKGPPPWAGKAARQGVVSVSHPLAAEAGARMLEAGGNAIDAAAAIQFALNVVEPQFSGIGGGGFMMVHLAKTGETHVVDSRERAPAASDADHVRAERRAVQRFAVASTSGFAVGVPGTLLGVDTALKRWGTMSLRETLQPAIGLAENGFRINRFLAANIACAADGRNVLQPETAAIFCPGGRAACRRRPAGPARPREDFPPDRRTGDRRVLPRADRRGDRRSAEALAYADRRAGRGPHDAGRPRPATASPSASRSSAATAAGPWRRCRRRRRAG